MPIKTETPEQLAELIANIKQAQAAYSEFSQTEVDKIFKAAALAASEARIPLARAAVDETGMGVFEDKVIKNQYAAEYIYNTYKNTKTVGVIESDDAAGIEKIAAPIGVIAAVIPTTNPTSTAIFKTLLALKTRNGIVISPHPRAKKSTIEAARIVKEAAEKAGAPVGLIGWIDVPSLALSNLVMKEADIILATGGPGMVKAAYSSGKPAIGVGAGNTPAIIDSSANIKLAVSSIILSKTFDNGMICASEQSVVVDKTVYDAVKAEFEYRGCYFLSENEIAKVREIIIINGSVNAQIVGQTAHKIAALSGVTVPENTKILIGEVTDFTTAEEFAHEKLSPVLAFYKADNFENAIEIAEHLVEDGGYGHTSSVYLNERTEGDKFALFAEKMKTCRILLNTPSSQGGIGDMYNFGLPPSLTLGCGSWGGNSVSGNVGVSHLLNIKTVAKRRKNMLWFRTPSKIYTETGSLSLALAELKDEYNKKRVFLVTDNFLYKNGFAKPVTDRLEELDIPYSVFFDIEPDPTLDSAKAGAKLLTAFAPDAIIALGGGSAIDAAKIMWVLYEHPEADFSDMAARFSDIRKRIYTFPKLGVKATFIAIPTTAGTGTEVTPFAVITDNGLKYPLADYELLPNIAIVDANLMTGAPKSLTAASGIDALSHALEAYASIMATDFTDGLATQAAETIFEYLPKAYDDGADIIAREKTAYAATAAGMAFANAFLGVCHSMAHKLGSYHHIPHGIANALLLNEVINFNSSETPTKQAAFSRHEYPDTKAKYAKFAVKLGLIANSATDTEKVTALTERVTLLKQQIGIKATIADYGVDEKIFLDQLDEMSLAAFDDQCTGANPRYPLAAELKQMYLNAYYGKSK
ncbi:MAG: bifunctional acetaldehyde-CoA/alcohol dehydrogenase [Oscillospiraceae bacterium]|jgi:acetaldehyde dehydrogenase/alcohol dehydrogenase|nr:bifunctional acetaldehyde-CoA/alcohol dehydrogenase [Oscillospiraceae bacterium]